MVLKINKNLRSRKSSLKKKEMKNLKEMMIQMKRISKKRKMIKVRHLKRATTKK